MSIDTRYSFTLPEKDEVRFEVVSFKGYEALSQPFHFTFELYSESADLAVRQLLGKKASFTLQVLGKTRTLHGMVAYCRILHPIEKGYLYQLRMVPRLCRLEMIQTNEIYLEQTLPDTLNQVLEAGEFDTSEYDLQQLGDYRQWEFRCQFGESHLSFLQRITEREGIYYRFEHLDEHAKVIFHDASSQHLKDPQATLVYRPETGMVPKTEEGLLTQWISHGEPLPRSITLKDYNSNTPSSQIQGQAQVDEQGFGSIYRYCDNLINTEEAEKLAEIRAQELMMKSEIFHGESRDVSLQTGLAFTVEGHFRTTDTGDFYPFVIEHEGVNPAFRRLQPAATAQAPYSNRIQALRTSLQFRPAITTEKPRFHGVLNAFIDAGEDERYAHIDAEGRYKVILPFDRERSPGEGKASCWIAMMQPSAGTGGGMHFPLLKGTEVLLSFIGGDPDRPIISGALPNAAHPSVVKDENKTRSLLRSASGNRMELEDEEGKSRLKLFSPTKNTYLHLGAANHGGEGFTLSSDGLYRYGVLGGSQTLIFAKGYEVDDQGVDKFPYDSGDDSSEDQDKFDEQKLFPFPKFSSTTAGKYEDKTLTREEELSGAYIITRRAGDQYHWADGNVYNFSGNGSDYNYGGGDETLTFFVEPGNTRYTAMKWDVPTKPTGAENWGFDDDISGDDTAWSPEKHYVEKSWGNTFTYQMGNNYSWGDTADYDFGNGYSEAHINPDGKINQKIGNDLVDKGGPYLSKITGNNIIYTDPGTVLIEKTFGDVYEYRGGKILELHDGEAEEHHHGTSWSYKHGDSFEETYGLAKSIHHGRSEDYFMGGTLEMSFAAGKALNLSITSEITAGAASEIFLGGKNEISVAAANDMFFGAKFELNVATLNSITVGVKNEVDVSVKNAATVTKLETDATNIKNNLSAIDNKLTSIGNSVTAITNAATAKIGNALLTLIN